MIVRERLSIRLSHSKLIGEKLTRFFIVFELINPTIVRVQLDVDIVEGENKEFYREILEYVDKHHHVIPSMDILDRITIKFQIISFIYYFTSMILTVNIPGRNNFSHNNTLLFI